MPGAVVSFAERVESGRGVRILPFLAVLATFLLSFLAYLSTLAPTVTWSHGGADSGELIVATYHLGVAHPSGYPTFVLFGKLFTFLPWGEVAFRVNLMSACFASLAAALVSLIIWLVLKPVLEIKLPLLAIASLLGGLLLAYSSAFWSQAVIAEVYSLNAFLFALVFLLLIVWRRSEGSGRQRVMLWLVAFTCGLSLTNHMTSLLAFPGVLLFTLLTQGRSLLLDRAGLMGGAAAFMLGLTPYLLLPIRSQQQVLANWGDPSSLSNFVAHVTGSSYRSLLFSAGPMDLLPRIPAVARLLLEQYGWIGFILSLVGLWYLWYADRALLLTWVLNVSTTLFFTLNYPARDSQVYLIPIYLMLALASGVGFAFGVSLLKVSPLTASGSERSSLSRRYMAGIYDAVVVGLAFLLVVIPYGSNRSEMDLSEDREAYEYAYGTLTELPSGSILLTNEDRHTFSLWYLLYVERFRRDLVVLDSRLLQWDWYVANVRRLYPQVGIPAPNPNPQQQIISLVRSNLSEREIYLTYSASYLMSSLEGSLFRVESVK